MLPLRNAPLLLPPEKQYALSWTTMFVILVLPRSSLHYFTMLAKAWSEACTVVCVIISIPSWLLPCCLSNVDSDGAENTGTLAAMMCDWEQMKLTPGEFESQRQ